jgi:hypothetical protein
MEDGNHLKEQQQDWREEEKRIEEDKRRTTNEEKNKALSCIGTRQFAEQTAGVRKG